MHRDQPFPAPEQVAGQVPFPVWALMERMCRKRPEKRYQRVAEVVGAVDRILDTLSVVPEEK
jgi:hypothetical protein